MRRQLSEGTRGRIVALLRRGPLSVDALADALGVTSNAVRAQLTALERDGVVTPSGVRRSGGAGKPATLFALARQAEEEMSSAYAPVLAALLAELGDRMKPATLDATLRSAGRRIAPAVARGASLDERVRQAAATLAALGADAEVVRTGAGYEVRGHGCPLAQAVTARPETCRALEAMLAETTGAEVHEHCEREERPRCRFAISAPRASGGSARR